MMRGSVWRWFGVVALGACSHEAPLGAQCPELDPSCVVQAAEQGGDGALHGGSGAGTSAPPPSDAATVEPAQLALMIVDGAGWPTTSAELSCESPCIDVSAVATGGAGAYTFAWSDGATDAARSLCPSSDATYSVVVRDDTPAGMATASIALTTTPCPLPDGGAITPPDGCEPDPLVLRALSCSFDGVPGALVLRAGQSYTVRLHSNLTSESMVQLQGWMACSAVTLDMVTLPAGPFDVVRCIAAEAEDRWLALGLFSGLDGAIWTPEGLSGEVCAGCE